MENPLAPLVSLIKSFIEPKKKAPENQVEKQPPPPKSAIIDPFNGMGILGVRQKPSSISFTTLRRMARIPAISAIIQTRLSQVARFAKRPRFDGDTGFKIALKDKEKKMTSSQKKRAIEIENFFLNTGARESLVRKDNFNLFLRKIVRDSLEIDALTWENVFNHKGELSEIWAVDSATIEIVLHAPTGELNDPPVYVPVTKRGMERSTEDITYVQKVNGQVTAEYTETELTYGIRNARTDLEYTGFGMSELETLIEIVTGIINGIKYNTSYFSESHLPQGVAEIIGRYSDEDLEAFERHWKTLMEGAEGKWRVPFMVLEEGQGFKFTPFKNSNRDMEFNEFLEFLFNIACAVYQIDPNEVGFKSWTSSNSMSQSDNTAKKLEHSMDKGFIPLMNFISDTFNSEIVDQIDDELEFVWVGVDEQDEVKKWEHIKAKLDAGIVTVAEVRRQEDLPELLDKDGEPELWTIAPAHPQLIQVFLSSLNKQQDNGQEEQEEIPVQSSAEPQQTSTKKADIENPHVKAVPESQATENMKKSLINEASLPDVPFDWEDY